MTRSGTIAFTPPTGWAPRPGDDPPRFWMRFSTDDPGVPRSDRAPSGSGDADAGRHLLGAVRDHLEPRRILTTRPVAVGPVFVPVGVEALVARSPDADPDGAAERDRRRHSTRSWIR